MALPLLGFLGRTAAMKFAKKMGSNNTVKLLKVAEKKFPKLGNNARRQFESGK